MTLDLAIGETSEIESTDKGKIQDIVQKVKDLNGRLADIKREQVFQRVSSLIPKLSHDLETKPGLWDSEIQILTFLARNVRQSSEINPRLPMQELSDGPWSSS